MAGYQHYDKFGDLDAEGLKIHFDINAIGPLLMVQALRQNLQQGHKGDALHVGCMRTCSCCHSNVDLQTHSMHPRLHETTLMIQCTVVCLCLIW